MSVGSEYEFQQSSGTYFLPKQLLQVNVQSQPGSSTPVISLQTVPVPDKTAQLQIGFELSPLADDNIEVDYENGLLSKIDALSVDHTGDVIVAIAKDIGELRAGTANTSNVTVQFDPFDFADAARANKLLGVGNCVEVEVEPGLWSPGCSKNYSIAGLPTLKQDGGYNYAQSITSTPGIYYRRAQPYKVHTVSDGKTVEVKSYLFANRAPVLRVDIDRTAFVSRETKLAFTGGN